MDLPADNERPEWEALLAAIADASDTFTFAEIGAGYGRWTMRAHELAVARDLAPALVAVEAEPNHFADLRTQLGGRATLIHAAVAARPGRVLFSTGRPDQYGQQILTRPRVAVHWLRRGGRVRVIRAITLNELLAPYPHVDLIDLDVQGAEADILEQASLANVRRVHVGTHSRELERRVRARFIASGWDCEADYDWGSTQETPWGRITFEDGAQTWLNPHIEADPPPASA